MDASEGENAEIIEKYEIMAFPGVLKIKGSKLLSKMEPGMADMPMMGYNWLATAADLNPEDVSGGMGFPLPIFAKKKSHSLNLNNKGKASWEEPIQSPSGTMLAQTSCKLYFFFF